MYYSIYLQLSISCILFYCLDPALCHAIFHPRTVSITNNIARQSKAWNQSLATLFPSPGVNRTTPQAYTVQCGSRTSTFDTDPFLQYDKVCPLWNTDCKGDKKEATSIFRTWYPDIFKHHPCWKSPYCRCKANGQEVPQASSIAFADVLTFSRSKLCVSLEHALFPSVGFDSTFCCTGCAFVPGIAVDLYYWPQPDANRSCLSIIGDGVVPDTKDATTQWLTYGHSTVPLVQWGCTTIANANDTASNANDSYVTTATLTTAGTLTMKQQLYNPWSLPFKCKVARSFSALALTVMNTTMQRGVRTEVVTTNGFTLYEALHVLLGDTIG